MTDSYIKILQRTIKNTWEKDAVGNFGGEHFTFADFATNIEKLHILFEATGAKAGTKIAICAKNSARWAISFFSVCTYNGVAVPILSDFHAESIAHLTNHSESEILFTDKDIWDKLDKSALPLLKLVINVQDFTILYCANESINECYANLPAEFEKKFPMGFSRESVIYPEPDPDTLAIINYTSGTTSAPKGVMLKHRSISEMVNYSMAKFPASSKDSMVSMLPMAHMYGLAFELIYPLLSGVSITYLGKTPSPSLLLKAMKSVRPYLIVTVPLVMEKIYKSSIKPLLSKPYIKILTIIPGISHLLYKKIGEKIDQAFGGNVKQYIMGGAPLNPTVENLFKKIGLKFTIGYGMTEACPLLCYTTPEEFKIGSCGKPVDCVEIRIDSEDPEHIAGEIQAKGPTICCGYFKNEEANALAFTDDGFLKTGDLGVMGKDGTVYIKGRSKSMILSANGQNIYPEELEAIINSQAYVAESLVVERSSRIVAMIYLDEALIRKDKLDNEIVSDIPEKVRINANRLLPAYSQIAKVEVVPAPFEKTPKLSIKRFLYK